MQFLKLTAGGPNLSFPESTTFNLPFSFPQPAQSAHALLQGFDFAFEAPDHQIRLVKFSLRTLHGAGDRSGTVEVKFAFSDDSTSFFESNHIGASISILVVGS